MSLLTYHPSELCPDGQDEYQPSSDRKAVVPEQWSIVVYRNSAGGFVVRARDPSGDDLSDHCVVLSSAEGVRSLIAALSSAIGDT